MTPHSLKGASKKQPVDVYRNDRGHVVDSHDTHIGHLGFHTTSIHPQTLLGTDSLLFPPQVEEEQGMQLSPVSRSDGDWNEMPVALVF
jgi:hypothetical protein